MFSGRQPSLLWCSVFAVAANLLVAPLPAAEPKQTNSLGIELRLLEGGRFIMGSDARERRLQQDFPLSVNAQFFGNAEYPAHVTWLSRPFWIGTTEVTVGQWKKFIAASGYVTTAEKSGEGMIGWSPTPVEKPLYQSHDFERKPEFSWKNPGFPQQDDHPVVGVSWEDAQAFLKWLSQKEGVTYRLPTEAEWEFACRAGTDSWFSFGDQARGVVHRHANLGNVELEKHRKHSVERQWLLDWESEPADLHVFTAPVASFQANPFGLHDLHGNAWEWCADLWLDTYYKRFDQPERLKPRKIAVDPVNDSEPQTQTNRFRTIRGGSWYNGPIICRASNRTAWDEPDAACYIGFRVVREADPELSTAAAEALASERSAKAAVEKAGGAFSSSNGIELEVLFQGDTLTVDGLAALAGIPDIERLNLGQKNASVLTDAELDAITRISSLKQLEFRGSFDLSQANLGLLAELPHLEDLQFSRSSSLRDEDLAKLAGLTTLKVFRCYGASGGLTDAGIAHLAGNQSLQRLDLNEVDATGSFLAGFSTCPITELAITSRNDSEVKLTDANAQAFKNFPALTRLELNQQDRLTGTIVPVIGGLLELTQLGLHGCSGIPAGDFAPLGKLIMLRTLNLQGTRAGDEAVAELAAIPRIETLRLGCEQLTDRGLGDIARLFSLENLYIETCSASDEGIKQLGRINRLRQLDLGAPAITGTGLGPIGRLPELNDLRLRAPALTNVVFELFARAKNLRKLRLVERGWQPPAALTDEGLLAIAPATWLSELWLPRNDTGITEAGIDALKERMPKTSVIPYTVNWDRPAESAD